MKKYLLQKHNDLSGVRQANRVIFVFGLAFFGFVGYKKNQDSNRTGKNL